MEKTTLIACVLGMICYFLSEFHSKGFKASDFSIKFWIRDNALNILSTAAVVYAWLYIKDGMTKEMAFLLGFSWNKIWDYLQDFTSKKTTV